MKLTTFILILMNPYLTHLWADRAGLPTVGTPSAMPSVWVGVHPELCWTLRAPSTSPVCVKHQMIVCWRSDHCWFGSEQVGDGCGSDPGGTASHLAHIKKCRSSSGSGSDTPCREKPRSGTPAWKELLAVDVCGFLVWCCVAVCLVSVSAITMVVLPFWLRTLCTKVFRDV